MEITGCKAGSASSSCAAAPPLHDGYIAPFMALPLHLPAGHLLEHKSDKLALKA